MEYPLLYITVCTRTIDPNVSSSKSSNDGKSDDAPLSRERGRVDCLPRQDSSQNQANEETMKILTATLTLLMFSGVASAQNPDTSKWMCRNLSESGGFLYQGETIFGSQACRPIPQTAPAAFTQTRHSCDSEARRRDGDGEQLGYGTCGCAASDYPCNPRASCKSSRDQRWQDACVRDRQSVVGNTWWVISGWK